MSIWSTVSNLGIDQSKDNLLQKANSLANKVNFVLILILTVLNLLILYLVISNDQQYDFFGLRLIILEALLISNLFWASRGRFAIVKLILIIFPVLILIILPSLLGIIQTSSFFYYHIVVIGFSLVPVVILIPSREKLIYILSISYFGVLMFFIDDIMIDFSVSDQPVKDLISHFRIYYKIVPFFIFCFLHFGFFYLRNMTTKYEEALESANDDLSDKLDEVERMQTHLIQSEKMASLGTMVAGVAHEINNPLNYISGGMAIVNKELGSIDFQGEQQIVKEGLSMMKEGVGRASHIVKSMKSFAYKGSNVKELVDLESLIDDCLLFLNMKTKLGVNIHHKYEFKGQVPVYNEKIQHVIINILDNSIFAIGDQKTGERIIRISTSDHSRKDQKFASIKIFNSGPQIPEEVLSKIFDPFYTTKDPGVGTGLGLSISYSHINDHNGEIHVNNLEGGVEFEIRLPIN